MKLARQILKIVAVVAGLLVVGLLVCPNPTGRSKVDPVQLLRDAKAAQQDSKTDSFRFPKDTSGFTPIIEGKETIAGHEAWVLRLRPKAKRLPWNQYWIDEKTRAVVAFREWNGANHITRQWKAPK